MFSYLSLLFSETLHSVEYIFPFFLCLSLLFFSQLFVRTPQTTTLPSCVYFSWRWFQSPPRDFPSGSDGKASAYNSGDLGSIPGLGRSPGERNGNPFQYSCLENPMDRETWQATVHGVAKSRKRLSDIYLLTYSCTMVGHSGMKSENESRSVMSDSLQSHGLVHGILGQNTGVGTVPFSRGSSWPRNQTGVSCIAGGLFTN